MRRQAHLIRLSCVVCRRKFYARRKSAKYCSGKCRTFAHRQRHEDKRINERMRIAVSHTNLGAMAQKARLNRER